MWQVGTSLQILDFNQEVGQIDDLSMVLIKDETMKALTMVEEIKSDNRTQEGM